MGKWKKSSEELVEKFHSVMDGFADVDRKTIFGYPCCFLRGNMFTGLHKENWVLRLKEEDREVMITEHGAKRFAPIGRLMKEYLILPQTILDKSELLASWIAKSVAYTTTLPIKLPKKK